MRRRIGRIGSKWGSNGRSCASGFSWAGLSCVISLGIGNCLWLVFYRGCKVCDCAPPLVFGRGGLPSVVVWSWSMGLARLGAQGAVGVLSGLVAGGVLVVVVLVMWGGVLCLYLLEWGGQGWRRRVIL